MVRENLVEVKVRLYLTFAFSGFSSLSEGEEPARVLLPAMG
jgi:hypothetical protein